MTPFYVRDLTSRILGYTESPGTDLPWILRNASVYVFYIPVF
jgi:hypothetical protein